jgi:hypothetical protein
MMNHLLPFVSKGFLFFKGVGIIFLRCPAFLLSFKIFLDSSENHWPIWTVSGNDKDGAKEYGIHATSFTS